MNELRQNMATKRWVIIATERAKRPSELTPLSTTDPSRLPVYDPDCPFCPGNEEMELERLRTPSVGDWQVRVVANLYPALRDEGARVRSYDGVHRNITAVGYHDIVVETPLHNACTALRPVGELGVVFSAFQQRGLQIAQDPRVEHVIYFKNHGTMAGSSMPHPHAQIIGLPIVPADIRSRIEEARRYFDDTGDCVLCTMLAREREDGRRIVVEGEHATAFVPYAAFSPFHMWIVPHRHEAHFRNAGTVERQGVASVLHTILRKLYIGVGNPDFNYVIRSAPVYDGNNEYLHWYVTVVPRVTQMAGFELGADMFINPTLPEESAAFLRGIEV
jgi:UDPglucose--hexose-1-phosphate uridylyltransferase